MVGESAIPKKLTVSPSAIRSVIAVRSGLTNAAAQATAINGLTLKNCAAVMAIKMGRNVNGVQEMKVKISNAPVCSTVGVIAFAM